MTCSLSFVVWSLFFYSQFTEQNDTCYKHKTQGNTALAYTTDNESITELITTAMRERSVNIENNNDNELKNRNDKNKTKYPLTMEDWNSANDDIKILKCKIKHLNSNIDNCKEILNYLRKAYLSQNMDAFELIWEHILSSITVLFCFVLFKFFYCFFFSIQ